MDEFFVEKKQDTSGAHIVHRGDCVSLPAMDDVRLIGVRSNAAAPLKEAANWFGLSAPCPKCLTS